MRLLFLISILFIAGCAEIDGALPPSAGSDGVSCTLPMTETAPGDFQFQFAVARETEFVEICVAADLDVSSLTLLEIRPAGFSILALHVGSGFICLQPNDAAFDDLVLFPETDYRLSAFNLALPYIRFRGDVCESLIRRSSDVVTETLKNDIR